ncbi:MAG: hypothetical protein K9W43_14095 [Candidatus Thorarchaeota archaeon]|nr:hypothetical protein [Candidatus Thorarchaeota archaeon]
MTPASDMILVIVTFIVLLILGRAVLSRASVIRTLLRDRAPSSAMVPAAILFVVFELVLISMNYGLFGTILAGVALVLALVLGGITIWRNR